MRGVARDLWAAGGGQRRSAAARVEPVESNCERRARSSQAVARRDFERGTSSDQAPPTSPRPSDAIGDSLWREPSHDPQSDVASVAPPPPTPRSYDSIFGGRPGAVAPPAAAAPAAASCVPTMASSMHKSNP